MDRTRAHNPSVNKGCIKLEGKKNYHLRNTNDTCEFEKKCHLQRLNGDHEINKIIQDALVSHDRNRALYDCEKKL